MIIEESIDIHVAPDAIMRCYRDVAAWPEWDPDTRAASIDGPFAVGSSGTLRPTKGMAVSMRLTSVSAHGFTVVSRVPLCTMRFDHDLIPIAGGTRVTHRVSFDGMLAGLFGRVVGAGVRRGLPVTLARLKARLEAQR